ncbi:MAG TPA: RNA methyltransferase [Gammaproteobacteria bacterium]
MLENISDKIRIVMVETSHPGNIGAAARAMKTMCQQQLYLVRPKIFPSGEVTARAAGADDILSTAVVCETLQEAVHDCGLIIATTARMRRIPWPVYSSRECAEQIINSVSSNRVAIVFGRESSGLNNDEIELCNAVLQIPTNPGFSSLNIASAIQIICYEILMASGQYQPEEADEGVPLATADELAQFYEHFEASMTDIGFYDPKKPRQLLRRLKRLFNRALLDQNEINILRGMLTKIEEATGKKKK